MTAVFEINSDTEKVKNVNYSLPLSYSSQELWEHQ